MAVGCQEYSRLLTSGRGSHRDCHGRAGRVFGCSRYTLQRWSVFGVRWSSAASMSTRSRPNCRPPSKMQVSPEAGRLRPFSMRYPPLDCEVPTNKPSQRESFLAAASLAGNFTIQGRWGRSGVVLIATPEPVRQPPKLFARHLPSRPGPPNACHPAEARRNFAMHHARKPHTAEALEHCCEPRANSIGCSPATRKVRIQAGIRKYRSPPPLHGLVAEKPKADKYSGRPPEPGECWQKEVKANPKYSAVLFTIEPTEP